MTPRESTAWLTVPNALTLLRLALIVPFAMLAAGGEDGQALAVLVAAGLTDVADGMIARRFGQSSKAGRLLDPLADKLLTGTAFVVLALFREGFSSIPVALMAAAIGRDVLILAGSALIYTARRESGFKPSALGKLNTFVEIGVVVWFLAATGLPRLAPLLPLLYGLMAATLAASMADYLVRGLRLFRGSRSPDSVPLTK
jgi:cardiolipin synthase